MKNYLKNNKKFRLKFLFSAALPLQVNGDGLWEYRAEKKMKINTLGKTPVAAFAFRGFAFINLRIARLSPKAHILNLAD